MHLTVAWWSERTSVAKVLRSECTTQLGVGTPARRDLVHVLGVDRVCVALHAPSRVGNTARPRGTSRALELGALDGERLERRGGAAGRAGRGPSPRASVLRPRR